MLFLEQLVFLSQITVLKQLFSVWATMYFSSEASFHQADLSLKYLVAHLLFWLDLQNDMKLDISPFMIGQEGMVISWRMISLD